MDDATGRVDVAPAAYIVTVKELLVGLDDATRRLDVALAEVMPWPGNSSET